ncbi:MAG: ATP-binding protein [Candidatus Cryptobacteroides sp.]|jgi:predicted AAA+ superfamily ATPase|nr:ATP-binding protein [Rikenellaceae bacterium]
MAQYKNRVADQLLKDNLEAAGLVLIEGTKWCGKTTTAEQQAASIVYMNDPEHTDTYQQLAQTAPKLLLRGDTPRLIDEWQDAPELWDAARFEIDHRKEKTGQFIFTGSTVIPDEKREKMKHSGTGRVAWFKMRPMSLWESGESNGHLSLADLFADKARSCETNVLDINNLAWLICRGGWPASLSMSKKGALKQSINYVDAVASRDISEVDGVKRDKDFTLRLLRSYARFQGTQAPITSIYEDLKSNSESSMNENTISSYLMALRKLFVIEDMPAWNPNLRSKTAIRTSDTRYFVDPSIATASIGAGPEDLILDLNTMGLFFETMCVRDLRVYADALDGQLYHFREKNGLECDAVIHLRNGNYGLIEIKIGGEKLINEGAESLTSLAGKINTDKMKYPSFMMVLTGIGTYAYKRKDDIWVVPIGCLKP